MSEPQSDNPFQPPLAAPSFGSHSTGQGPVPYEPRTRVPWNGWDVLIVIFLLILWEMVATATVRHLVPAGAVRSDVLLPDVLPAGEVAAAAEPNLQQARLQLVAGGLATLAALISGIVVLKVRAQATWSDLGFSLRHVLYDVRLGVKAYLVILFPVYGLQFMLTRWFPSEHDLIKMVRAEPGRQTLVIASVMAVIIAPLVEEFLFRVVLQGWLESRESRWRRAGYPLFRGVPHGCGPIVLSAAPFALLHHWPDLVPLFVLAVSLGYLYRQTHRIWPSLVVHLCLNGTSMLLLWLSLLAS